MRKKFLLPSIIVFLLLTACSLFSPAPAPTPTENRPETVSQTPDPTQGISPTETDQPIATPVPPTSTPLPPSSTPAAPPTSTPTPTAVSLVLDAENVDQVAQVFDYADAFNAITGKDLFDLSLTSYDLAGDGSRLAFGICHANTSAFICSGEADNDVLVLNTPDGGLARHFEFGASGRLAEIALSADGKTLYILRSNLSSTTSIEAWNVENGESLGTLMQVKGRLDFYPRLCLSPDGRFIAASLGPLGLSVYAFSEQSVVLTDPGNFGRCRFSQDGDRLFLFLRDANSAGSGLVIFETDRWTQTARIDFENEAIGMSVSPDGNLVGVVHAESAAIWDIGTTSEVGRLEGPAGTTWNFTNLAFSPDGRMLAGLFRDYEYADDLQIGMVWDTENWRIISPILGMSVEPRAIRFDPRGEQFVVFDVYGPAQRFALPDQTLLAARTVLESYLDALSTGDYRQAADLYRLDLFDTSLPDWIRAQGGDTDDMAATFSIGCVADDFPCLPLLDIKFSGRVPWNSYLFVVTLKAEDGSAYVDQDGYSDFWMYAELDTDGSIRIITLHPGLFAP